MAEKRVLFAVWLAMVAVMGAGCSASSGLQDAAPADPWPNFNIVPRGETSQLTPQQEAAMLVDLISAMEAQPQLGAAEQRMLAERRQRLAVLAQTHAIDTERLIRER